MIEFSVEAPVKVKLTLEKPDGGQFIWTEDPYKIQSAIDDAVRREPGRWEEVVREWVSQQTGLSVEDFGYNSIRTINEFVVKVIDSLDAERKKKLESIASLPPPTPESPEITEVGI